MDPETAMRRIWQRTCAVRGCGHVADAGHLTDYCFDHACEIKRFALWLRYHLEDAVAALPAARHDVE